MSFVLLSRVSYCTVDPYYDKVFCYISRNPENKKLECHAFLCSKKSKVENYVAVLCINNGIFIWQAEAITLTVAQAFNIAYEKWQAHKKKKEERNSQQKKSLQSSEETVQIGMYCVKEVANHFPPIAL